MCTNGWYDNCDNRLKRLDGTVINLSSEPYDSFTTQFLISPEWPSQVYGENIKVNQDVKRWPDGSCRVNSEIQVPCSQGCSAQFRAEQDARVMQQGMVGLQYRSKLGLDKYCGLDCPPTINPCPVTLEARNPQEENYYLKCPKNFCENGTDFSSFNPSLGGYCPPKQFC